MFQGHTDVLNQLNQANIASITHDLNCVMHFLRSQIRKAISTPGLDALAVLFPHTFHNRCNTWPAVFS